MRRQRLRQSIQANGALDVKHKMRIDRGTCHDCSQGMLASWGDGFEYWNEESDGRGFWFCTYCGSNDVTVTCDAGVVPSTGAARKHDSAILMSLAAITGFRHDLIRTAPCRPASGLPQID
jgi:hypothetical protein